MAYLRGKIMVRNIRNATFTTAVATSELISEAKFSNQRRLVLEIANLNAGGGNDVWVGVGEEAKANYGRRIQPGQSIIWSTDGGYRPPNERVHILSAGATNVAIYEEIEVGY